jgi:hypothetical protein
MALKASPTEHHTTVGHPPHEALVRVHERVKQILARREAELQHARIAAQRLKRP